MNILFFTYSLTGGGAERVCVSIANGLSRMGHNVYIFTRKLSANDYEINDNVKIICRPINGNYIYRRIDYVKFLNYLLKKYSINSYVIVNAGWLLYSKIVCKINKVKIIYSDHNAFECPQRLPLKLRIRKFYESRFCDVVTVLTQRDKTLLKNRKNVVVAPNPLFLPVLTYIPPKEKIILAVGRKDAWYVKGFDLLIKAWGVICKDFPEWKLRIIGAGSVDANSILNNYIIEGHAERVELVDFSQNIVKEYQAAEVFVLSSRFEGFGLVLIEALSQRCACIACDYFSRQREIVTDNFDALICPAGDLSEMISKMRLILGNEALRKELQNHSIVNLEKYSISNISKMWESFLENEW